MDLTTAEHIADLITKKHSLEITDKAHADIELSVFRAKNSRWVTVSSDLIDGDVDALLGCAKDISQALGTETLAISCYDSDYLFMNLIDAQKGVDIWASCGRFPAGKAPRRSNYAAWKSYVGDAEAFRNAMRATYTFAEECLYAVEPMLSLPVTQSIGDGIDGSDVFRFYYKYSKREETVRPPVFGCIIREIYFHTGADPNVVLFQNQGDSSHGVAVCLTGPCIYNNQVNVTSICLQIHDKHGEWVLIPIELKTKEFSNGVQGLYGECREIRIPPAVSQELPWKKKMGLEFRHSIGIRFFLSRNGDVGESNDTLGDLHVILIPLQNFSGQHGLVLRPYQGNEYAEWNCDHKKT